MVCDIFCFEKDDAVHVEVLQLVPSEKNFFCNTHLLGTVLFTFKNGFTWTIDKALMAEHAQSWINCHCWRSSYSKNTCSDNQEFLLKFKCFCRKVYIDFYFLKITKLMSLHNQTVRGN